MKPIGTIRSPFKEAPGTPIQPAFAGEATGQVVVDEEFADALADIDGFERLWLIYLLDRGGPYRARVIPYLDTLPRGLFATRSPCRPNPIGLSAVRLLTRRGNVLEIAGVDMLDGTPLLDLKPYVPAFDAFPDSRAGWFDSTSLSGGKADDRFHRSE